MLSIIGGGNHAQDIKAIATRCKIYHVAFFDDDPTTGFMSPDDIIDKIIIGVNDPQVRRRIALRFSHLHGTQPLVDPSAIVGEKVTLGRGVTIAPLASLLTSVVLKDHVHVNSGAQLVRTNVGAYTTICPGAIICGNVDIGEACLIGAGSVICERVTIGDNVLIGAGAVVPPRSMIPDGSKVIGVWRASGSL